MNEEFKRQIVYQYQTWVNHNHSRLEIWTDKDSKGKIEVPVVKEGRLIILHIGSS